MEVNLVKFRQWLQTLALRDTSIRKAACDLRTLVNRPDLARKPTSLQRARDLRRVWKLYNEYADYAGVEHLPEPARYQDEHRERAGTAVDRALVRKTRRKKKDIVSIDLDEWAKLAAWVRREAHSSPAAAVLHALVRTGLRIGSVLCIDRETLKAALQRTDGRTVIEVKGGKKIALTVRSGAAVWETLYAHMEQRNAENVAAAVALGGDSNPLPAGAAYTVVRRRFIQLCKQIPITGKRNLHRIRRTVAIRLLEAGATREEVQEVLGHSSPFTTDIYTEEFKANVVRNALDKLTFDDD